jgi:SAM-dependent methyltransferase
MNCRSCGFGEFITFADLGFAPPSNSYLSIETKDQMEPHFPLRIFTCRKCFLVQTQDFAGREVFFSQEYAYFSSISKSWLIHCEEYVEKIVPRAKLTQDSLIFEVASNDGYLLEIFDQVGIPVIGIEPTESTAKVAQEKGIKTIVDFFSSDLAVELVNVYGQADLMVGNNVLAHVPDINDFVKGFSLLLKDNGIATFEFPHLLNLIAFSQFDTLYHEHYSYLSLVALVPLFERHGLRVFDVEELNTHGGSLRIYVGRVDSVHEICGSVQKILSKEIEFGLQNLEVYLEFQVKCQNVKNDLLEFLLGAKKEGKKIVGYGAAAKGNTLLNYCGIRQDIMEMVADANTFKQGKFLPGSCIPIVSPRELVDAKPDIVIILPWNLSNEVLSVLTPILPEKTEYLVAVPQLTRIR